VAPAIAPVSHHPRSGSTASGTDNRQAAQRPGCMHGGRARGPPRRRVREARAGFVDHLDVPGWSAPVRPLGASAGDGLSATGVLSNRPIVRVPRCEKYRWLLGSDHYPGHGWSTYSRARRRHQAQIRRIGSLVNHVGRRPRRSGAGERRTLGLSIGPGGFSPRHPRDAGPRASRPEDRRIRQRSVILLVLLGLTAHRRGRP
jgi:hypothetical protein